MVLYNIKPTIINFTTEFKSFSHILYQLNKVCIYLYAKRVTISLTSLGIYAANDFIKFWIGLTFRM